MAWAPDYIDAAAYKGWARIGDDVDDTEIAVAITSASRAVDRATGRQFGCLETAQEWTYTARWDRTIGRWVVVVDDVATTTGMVVTVDGTVVTDYTLGPRNAVAKGLVWTYLVLGTSVSCSGDLDGVGVEVAFGWPAFPAAAKMATRLQTSRFLARRDSPYGIAGSPQDGSEQRLLAVVDPDVRVSLSRYVRTWAVA